MNWDSTIPQRLSAWRNEELPLIGAGCSKCLNPLESQCCSFLPLFYNFHVGEILEFLKSQKVELTFEKILIDLERQYWLLPLGVRPKRAIKDDSAFCTFYESNRCSIWPVRPPECVSYFCEGSEQLKANFQQLNQVWHKAEAAVAQMALVEMGFNHHHLAEQLEYFDFQKFPELILENAKIEQQWGEFYRSRADYYLSCFRFAKQLTWPQINGWIEE